MSRNNNSRQWPRGDSNLRANRESRGGRVLKVFRRLDDDSFSIMGGAISELENSEDIPPIKNIPTKADAYLLDPRLMPRNFNVGFLTGYQFGRVMSGIQASKQISDKGYPVKVGELDLLDNRRTVVAEVKSDRIEEERMALYGILGVTGVKGFSESGHRKGHRDGTGPTFVVANLAQPLAKSSEDDVLDAMTTGIQVSLASASGGKVELGPLQIKTYMVE